MERSQRKKNYTTSKSRDDILTRKPSVLYLESLYLLSDNKHTQILLEVSELFLIAISVRETNGFSTICTCSLPSILSPKFNSRGTHSGM